MLEVRSDLTTDYKSQTYVQHWPFRLSLPDDLPPKRRLYASSGVSYRTRIHSPRRDADYLLTSFMMPRRVAYYRQTTRHKRVN